MFRQLEIKDFSPFQDQTIHFPEKTKEAEDLAEIHILTGINGTGKTRLLSILAAVLGEDAHLIKRLTKATETVLIEVNSPGNSITSRDGRGYYLQIHGDFASSSQNIPAFSYNGAAYVQDAKIGLMSASQIPNPKINLSFSRPPDQSQELLQSIANLKIRAAMENLNAGSTTTIELPRAVRLIKRLESTLSSITGQNLTFHIESYGEPNIMVNWGNNEKLLFSLLPDGLRSIIGWLAHAVVMMDATLQGKEDPIDSSAIFLLDEIESHLHPSWQRKILPAFQKLFPKAQIFVATHSPFVISSINHGWIHCLVNENEGVFVKNAIPASRGDSYMSVLEDIMGLNELQSYDPETEQLLIQFKKYRDDAYNGNTDSYKSAHELALQIAERGNELRFMMGCEIAQMKKRLPLA
ncbi:MAG: ATP-binding protein [Verrucomicrobiales bacterium]|jgi:predicted ATP-binding protein involved in virulence|nr:ATP-binding protein [Verrucomicrobiales bacterium]